LTRHTTIIALLLAAVLWAASCMLGVCQESGAPRGSPGASLESGAEIEIAGPAPPASQAGAAGEPEEIGGSAEAVEVISGDLVRVGSSVSVPETEEVRGAVVSLWGSADIDGKVKKDVVVIGGPITLGPNAEVMGDCVAVGAGIDKAPGAKVHGDTVTVAVPIVRWRLTEGVPWLFGMGPLGPLSRGGVRGIAFGAAAEFAINLVLGLAVGAIILLLFPRRVSVVTATMNERPAKSLGAGILAAVVGVVVLAVSLLLILLLVGIPLVMIEISLLVAAMLLGEVAVALLLGSRIAAALNWQMTSQFGPLVIGILVFALLISAPYIGGPIHLVLFFVATGAVVLSGYGASTDWLGRRTSARPSGPVSPGPVGSGGVAQ
jgi:hypothetical protein